MSFFVENKDFFRIEKLLNLLNITFLGTILPTKLVLDQKITIFIINF